MGPLAFLALFVVVAGLGEGAHLWQVARTKRREDWLAEGNRRVW